MIRSSTLASIFLGAALLNAAPARSDTIHHPAAIFAGLDKITGRIITFDVAIDETVQFGTLQITPRVCSTRPQTEAPLTEGFVEVDEIESAKQAKRIFSGWMFAASPGLHGVEHPVYDVWLKDCKGGAEVVASPASPGPDVNAPPPANATLAPPAAPPRKARRTITPQNPVEPQVDVPPPAAGPDQPAPTADQPPQAAGPDQRQPSIQDNGMGAPVEVGPPPGANPKPDAAPKKPRKPKRKPPPPAAAPNLGEAPPPDDSRPRRERLEPVSPNDLPRDSIFR